MKQYPVTIPEQEAVALKVKCTFCNAEPGVKCKPGLIFPQYQHTPRICDGLLANGWTQEELDSCSKFS